MWLNINLFIYVSSQVNTRKYKVNKNINNLHHKIIHEDYVTSHKAAHSLVQLTQQEEKRHKHNSIHLSNVYFDDQHDIQYSSVVYGANVKKTPETIPGG